MTTYYPGEGSNVVLRIYETLPDLWAIDWHINFTVDHDVTWHRYFVGDKDAVFAKAVECQLQGWCKEVLWPPS